MRPHSHDYPLVMAVDREESGPLPPPNDARAGSWSCCADCGARELSKLCGSTCPRYRSPFSGKAKT